MLLAREFRDELVRQEGFLQKPAFQTAGPLREAEHVLMLCTSGDSRLTDQGYRGAPMKGDGLWWHSRVAGDSSTALYWVRNGGWIMHVLCSKFASNQEIHP